MTCKKYEGPVSKLVRVLRADAKYYGAADWLEETGDVCFVIAGVEMLERENVGGRTIIEKPALVLATPAGTPCKKKLILNSTNLKTIATLHGGKSTASWVGKRIWIGKDVTEKNVACLRVRNRTDAPRGSEKHVDELNATVSDDHPAVTHDPSESGIEPGDAAE